MFNSEEILSKYEIISFDIFDTLIRRLTKKPIDVFDLVEIQAVKENIPCVNFKKNRIKAEKIARAKSFKEISFDEIYIELHKNYSKDVCDKLKEIEILTELQICVPNHDVVNFYNQCKKNNKKIILISDMYLPENVIRKILDSCGIYGYADIYVSSVSGNTKASGTLYRYVKKNESIEYSHWCHIGDNLKSDVLIPEKLGIYSVHISKDVCDLKFSKSVDDKNIFDTMINRFLKIFSPMIKNQYMRLGYELYGPLLFKFITWINHDVKMNGIDNILFCARDGYYFSEAFKKLEEPQSNIKSEYIYISRKSLVYPLLYQAENFQEFYSIMWKSIFPRMFTVKQFLEYFNFNHVSTEEMKPFSLDTVLDRNSICENKDFQRFFKYLTDKFSKEIKSENDAFFQYINTLKIDFSDERKIALVDIGWNGSTQAVLEKILNHELWGYYLGYRGTSFSFNHAKGYLANDWLKCQQIGNITNLLELVFSAPHGSLKAYKKTDDGYELSFDKYEHLEDEKYLNEVCSGAMKFLDDLKLHGEFIINNASKLSDECTLFKVGMNPNRKFLSLMEKFVFLDGEKKFICNPKSFAYYLFHWKKFLKDFFESPWPVGFLTKIFYFNWPFRMYYMYIINLLITRKVKSILVNLFTKMI